MDGDSDLDKELDNSLGDLHHGLDSSLDENTSGLDKREFSDLNNSHSKDTFNEDEMADDQMSMLQDMVVEMKQGFQSALQELAKIQEKEEGETTHSKKLQQQQQRQLDDLTEAIHEIKSQLSSLSQNMEQIKEEQKTLKESLEEVRSNRGSSQESKTRSDEDRPDLLDDFSAPPEDWNTRLSELPDLDGDHNDTDHLPNGTDNDVTAIACKSLSLTQALGQKCLNLNLSASSDEEEEEMSAEGRRASQYTPKTTQLVSESTGNRRHTMPAQPTPPGRNKDIGNAAQRQKAVKELADSERDYCSRLWSLLHTYLAPLQTAGFLSGRELEVLFPSYLEQLYAEHCDICTGLQDRLVQWSSMQTVADLLSRVTGSHNSDSLISMYKDYSEDLPSAVTCLRRAVTQSSEFRSFLKAIKRSSCQSEDLMSLVMVPVQHVPRYLLLLQQVAHYTLPTHPDYPLLQTSLHRLRTFVDQLNKEVANTIQALTNDGSPRDSGQVLSARDSGVHSNSTEDETITSARAFSKLEGGHVLPEWLEDPYYDSHHRQMDENFLRQRQLRPSSARLNTLSQPDLTVYKNLNTLTSDPRMVPYIPRSQSSLPTGAGGDDVGDNMRGRQHRKYKVKKRHQSPVGYSASSQDHVHHHNLSPRIRPSSAIDFLSHSQQQYHPNHYRDPAPHARGFLYPGPQPRPHSALGPHVMDPHHKPTIISRKHLRRSQPPMPSSTSYWAENSSSAIGPTRAGHLRGPLSSHDLLPARPAPYHSTDIMDYDDDEDDTRASDTHSLGTSGSHQPSSSHCSNEDRDFELDLHPGQLGGQNLGNPEFSSAEVTANLARKLCTDQETNGKSEENVLLRNSDISTAVSKSKVLATVETKLSSSLSSKPQAKGHNEDGNVKEVYGTSTVEKGGQSLASTASAHTTNSYHDAEIEVGLKNPSSASEKVSNLIKTISNSTKSLDIDGEDGGETESHISDRAEESRTISENNRQFLLSLTNRSSGRSGSSPIGNTKKEDSSLSSDSKHEIHGGNLTPFMNKSNHQELSSDGYKSLSSNSVAGTNSPNPSPQSNKSGTNPQTNSSVSMNGSPGVTNSEYVHFSHRLSQPLPFRGTEISSDGTRVSLNINQTATSPNSGYPKSRSQVLSAGDLPHTSLLSTSSQETANHSKLVSSSLDSQVSHPSPLFTSSTRSASNKSMTSQPLETAIDTPRGERGEGRSRQLHVGHDDITSYPDHNALPPLEVADVGMEERRGGGGGDVGKRRDGRKKVKEERKSYPTDNLPKASDDPVGARKKMHFKASIKNLFAKKKGRVILADVEREVVMEMATAAAAATTNTTSTKTTSPASPKVAFSKNKKPKQLSGIIPPESCITDKHSEDSAFEIKTRKDQSSSTSSPVKVSKRFHFYTKQPKQVQNPGDCSERTGSEFAQLQHHHNILDKMKAHNKRHGIIFENQDASFPSTIEADHACGQPSKPYVQGKDLSENNHHFKENWGSDQLQVRHQESTAPNNEKLVTSASQESSASDDRATVPIQCKYPSDQKEVVDSKLLQSNEMDLLKSIPHARVKNRSKAERADRNSKEMPEHASVLLSSQDSRTKAGKTQNDHKYNEHSQKKSQASNIALCQQCQSCETRLTDKLSLMGKIKGNDQKHDQTSVKNCEFRLTDKNSADLSRKRLVCVDSKCSSRPSMNDKISATSTIQRNVLFNDLNDGKKPLLSEKVLLFPCTEDPANTSLTDCLKPCADAILLYETSKNNKMTSSYPVSSKDLRKKHKKSEEKFKLSTLSPVYEQRSPVSRYQPQVQPEFNRSSPPVINKLPVNISCGSRSQENEKLKISDSTLAQDTNGSSTENRSLAGMKTSAMEGKTLPSLSPESIDSKNAAHHLTSLPIASADHEGKAYVPSSSISTCPISLQKLSQAVHNPSGKLHHLKDCQKEKTISEHSSNIIPGVDCAEATQADESDGETSLKRYAVEDKEYFEHRYRLYYDDETNFPNNHKLSETSDPQNALTTSISTEVAAVPRWLLHQGSGNSIVDEHGNSSGKLTSMNSQTIPSGQTTENLLQSGQSHHDGDGNPYGRFVASHSSAVASEIHLHQTSSNDNALLSVCSSQALSQFPYYQPAYTANGLQCTKGNNQAIKGVGIISVPSNKYLSDNKAVCIPCFPSNLRLYPSCSSENRPRKSSNNTGFLSSTNVNERSSPSESTFSPTAPIDESSSYKPKNSTIPKILACTAHANTQGKDLTSSSMNGQTTQHLTVVSPSASSGNFSSSLCTLSDNRANVPLMLQSGKNGYSPTNHGLLPPGTLSCTGPSNDPFQEGSRNFLRTSSPFDVFSILPYKEYGVSGLNSDSSTLVPSDADSRSTPNSAKSASKSSSGKHDKGKKSTRNKKGKKESDKNRVDGASPNDSMDSYKGFHYVSYDLKPKRGGHLKGHRQGDGVILRAHDPNLHLPRHPRYSNESNPLIADEFLRKMAYLPPYNPRPFSHPHVDGSHLHAGSQSTSQATAHAELSKKSQGRPVSESPAEVSSHLSRHMKTSATSARNSPSVCIVSSGVTRVEMPQASCEGHQTKDRDNLTLSALAQTSPDLLPANHSLKEDQSSKDKSSSAKKAQSFFSRLTHSPMSFFYRDSKSSNPPK